jgi:C1A family cysteine protease
MKKLVTGYNRDKLDPRDYQYKPPFRFSAPLVPVDLRGINPVILDQGNLGSCTACAATSLVNFVRKKKMLTPLEPSPLFTYYTTRQIEKTTGDDSGATIRNAIKSTVSYGITLESLHPYIESHLTLKPSQQAYTEALKHQTLTYYRINNSNNALLQKCLSEGYPFIFGFAVYDNFWTDTEKPGARITLPTRKNYFCGGHAVVAEGWEIYKNQVYYIIKNSWGSSWGDKGYFRMPKSYITNTNYSTDFWTIRMTED